MGAAERLASVTKLLGRSAAEELLTEQSRRWEIDRELGIVAGTRRVGLGQFLTTLDGDNDGTVAVSETRLPGATDSITLPVSRMGLLMSARVARETTPVSQRGAIFARIGSRLTRKGVVRAVLVLLALGLVGGAGSVLVHGRPADSSRRCVRLRHRRRAWCLGYHVPKPIRFDDSRVVLARDGWGRARCCCFTVWDRIGP